MDANDKARAPEKEAARSGDGRAQSYRHGGRPDLLAERGELTQGELGLPDSQVPGHRWSGWRRLTGDEDYYAACSCGWRSTDTDGVSPMMRQVTDHLAAVRAVRGWGPEARTAQAPGRGGQRDDAGQLEPGQERARELYASVENQQRRLSQALGQSADLLSASEQQADRLVAGLEHAAAGVAPEWARTEDSVRRAETLQRRAERARELRDGIVAAAAGLAVIAEEIAVMNLGLGNGHDEATDRICGERPVQPT